MNAIMRGHLRFGQRNAICLREVSEMFIQRARSRDWREKKSWSGEEEDFMKASSVIRLQYERPRDWRDLQCLAIVCTVASVVVRRKTDQHHSKEELLDEAGDNLILNHMN